METLSSGTDILFIKEVYLRIKRCQEKRYLDTTLLKRQVSTKVCTKTASAGMLAGTTTLQNQCTSKDTKNELHRYIQSGIRFFKA